MKYVMHHKWKSYAQRGFLWRAAAYVFFLLYVTVLVLKQPYESPACTESTWANTDAQFDAGWSILAALAALVYLVSC